MSKGASEPPPQIRQLVSRDHALVVVVSSIVASYDNVSGTVLQTLEDR
jgi:hypothetical protein